MEYTPHAGSEPFPHSLQYPRSRATHPVRSCGTANKATPTPPISSVLAVAQSWEHQCGAGLSGKVFQALHVCTRREKECTPGREIIYGIARGKGDFFTVLVSLLLCPSMWTYGVSIAITLLKCARRLGRACCEKGWHDSSYAFGPSTLSDQCLEKVWDLENGINGIKLLNMPLVALSQINKIKICKRDLLAISITNGNLLKPGFASGARQKPLMSPCHAL